MALQADADAFPVSEYIQDSGDLGEYPYYFGAADAAYADEQDTRRSSQGYVFSLFRMAIDWKSTVQRTVTKSTTKAELLSLSLASSEMMEWARFFKGVSLKLNQTPVIWCDNQQTVGIAVKSMDKLSSKLKHVDIHQLWIRQEVEAGWLHVKWLPTREMPADGMTKALSRQLHMEFVKQLGLVDIAQRVTGTAEVPQPELSMVQYM
jgi:hypothetical protein